MKSGFYFESKIDKSRNSDFSANLNFRAKNGTWFFMQIKTRNTILGKKNRLAISGKHEKRLKIVFSYRIQNWFFWCVFHKRIFLFYFSVGAVRSGGFRDGITDRIEWNVMVNMSQTFSSQSGFFGTDDIVKRIFSDTFLDRSHPCRSIFFAIGWHSAMKNKKYTMHSRNWNWKASRCLKITEKVSFNITSEASYVYILSGQKFL